MNEIKENKRNYQVDNIRAILIFLVVFAHLIPKTTTGTSSNILYTIINSFHMEVFVYTNGLFAQFDRKKILKHFIWPYVFFQVVYHYYNTIVLHSNMEIQFTTPNKYLWYLLAMTVYLCLLPMFSVRNRRQAIISIVIASMFALLVGLDNTIGLYLSISRIVCFLPFFLLGLYFNLLFDDKTRTILRKPFVLLCCALIVLLLEMIIIQKNIQITALLLRSNYPEISYMVIRLIQQIIGVLCIVLFLGIIPNKKIRQLTVVGQNTMPVYLLQGFITQYINKFNILHYGICNNIIISAVLSLVIVIMFGNIYVGRLFKKLF